MNRAKKIALAFAVCTLSPLWALAATDEDAVARNVEAFRAAQMASDAGALTNLCAPELSYSHSDAHVEDRTTFARMPLPENQPSCRWRIETR